MKARILHTKFWQDEFILDGNPNTRYLYVYLLTCPYINMIGIFQIPLQYILLETGLASEQVVKAKQELEKSKKVFFKDSWVYIPKVDKYNKYSLGAKTGVAYKRELSELSLDIKTYFNSRYPIDSLSSTTDSLSILLETRKKKSEIIKHKEESRKKKSKDIGIEKFNKKRKELKV